MFIYILYRSYNLYHYLVTEADVRELTEEARGQDESITRDGLLMTDSEAQRFIAGWVTHKVCLKLFLNVNTSHSFSEWGLEVLK